MPPPTPTHVSSATGSVSGHAEAPQRARHRTQHPAMSLSPGNSRLLLCVFYILSDVAAFPQGLRAALTASSHRVSPSSFLYLAHLSHPILLLLRRPFPRLLLLVASLSRVIHFHLTTSCLCRAFALSSLISHDNPV